jgi:hypothetical protein
VNTLPNNLVAWRVASHVKTSSGVDILGLKIVLESILVCASPSLNPVLAVFAPTIPCRHLRLQHCILVRNEQHVTFAQLGGLPEMRNVGQAPAVNLQNFANAGVWYLQFATHSGDTIVFFARIPAPTNQNLDHQSQQRTIPIRLTT